MSALDWINAGIKTLIPGIVGWVLVFLVLKDARHRAWAAILTLGVMLIVPMMPEWGEAVDSVLPEEVMTWKPEWNVTVTEASPVLPVQGIEKVVTPPQTWNLPHWSQMVVGIWLVGSITMGVFIAWKTMLTFLAVRSLPLHFHSDTWVRVTDSETSPCLAGAWKPEVVVPRSALSWSVAQWNWMMAHEGEHLRGHDCAVGWMMHWVRAALWWNPLVHSIIQGWEQAREEICDHVAARGENESVPYSEFLLAIATPATINGVAMAASHPARRLRARLIALLEHRQVRRRPHWAFVIMGSALVAVWTSLSGCVQVQLQVPNKDEGPMMTRSYYVDGDILSSLSSQPTASTVAGATSEGVQEGLQNMGVAFVKGASVESNGDAGKLVVKNHGRRLGQIEQVLAALKSRDEFQNVQILVRSKWVEMPLDMASVDDLSVLSDIQFQALMRNLSQKKGVELLTSPTVTTRIGQRAVAEVYKEIPAETGKDRVGISNAVIPLIRGDQIQLGIVADLGVAMSGGRRFPWGRLPEKGKVRVKHLQRQENISLRNGEAVALDLGQPVASRKVVLFVSVQLLSPGGKYLTMSEALQVRGQSASVNASASSPKGKLRLKAELFTVPADDTWQKVRPMEPAGGVDPSANTGWRNLFPPMPTSVPEGVLSLAGVFTTSQFTKEAAHWRAVSGMPRHSGTPVMTDSSKDVNIDLGDSSHVAITPVVGKDGYTIDLQISPKLKLAREVKSITTSITIWDGQTVLLGGVMTGKVGQLLAITAEIVK